MGSILLPEGPVSVVVCFFARRGTIGRIDKSIDRLYVHGAPHTAKNLLRTIDLARPIASFGGIVPPELIVAVGGLGAQKVASRARETHMKHIAVLVVALEASVGFVSACLLIVISLREPEYVTRMINGERVLARPGACVQHSQRLVHTLRDEVAVLDKQSTRA